MSPDASSILIVVYVQQLRALHKIADGIPKTPQLSRRGRQSL